MRLIPIFIVCLGISAISAACTSKPERETLEPPPEPEPVATCQEACAASEDCADGSVCCLDAAVCGAKNRCVACASDADCGDLLCVAGACAPCREDADCAGSPAGELCNPDTNACVACLDDSVCAAGERCNSSGQCSCGSSARCTEPGLGLCRDEGCVCSDDSGCPTGAKTCILGVCVACADDTHCGADEKCFAASSIAAYCGCTKDEQCGSGKCEVTSGACVACLGDADCAGSAAGSKCAIEGGFICVQCLSDADCAEGASCAEGVCTCSDASECEADNSSASLDWVCEP
jgi:Cys-rich repeat protein